MILYYLFSGGRVEADVVAYRGFKRHEVVRVRLADGTVLGAVGEKIAGGLYEVVLEVNGGWASGVFRTDELIPTRGRGGSERKAKLKENQ